MKRGNTRRGPFSTDEIEYLHRWYPTRGARWCAERLCRTPHSIHHAAARQGLTYGLIKGLVRIAHLARAANDSASNVTRAAQSAGVIKRIGNRKLGRRWGARLALVPERWAEEYLRTREERLDGETAREAGYLTRAQCAAAWRVSRSTVLRAVNGTGTLAPLLKTARITRGNNGGSILINPHDAETVRRKLEKDRRLAERLTSTKSLAVDLGLKQQYLAELGREAGGRLLLTNGRWCCYLTSEQVDAVLDRVEGLTLPPPGWVSMRSLSRASGRTPPNVLSWMNAKSRRAPLRKFREPASHVPAWYAPPDWAKRYLEWARATDQQLGITRHERAA